MTTSLGLHQIMDKAICYSTTYWYVHTIIKKPLILTSLNFNPFEKSRNQKTPPPATSAKNIVLQPRPPHEDTATDGVPPDDSSTSTPSEHISFISSKGSPLHVLQNPNKWQS
jgi:hypothetical protein